MTGVRNFPDVFEWDRDAKPPEKSLKEVLEM